MVPSQDNQRLLALKNDSFLLSPIRWLQALPLTLLTGQFQTLSAAGDAFLRGFPVDQQVIKGGSGCELLLNPFRLPAAACPGFRRIIRVAVFRADAPAPVFLRSHVVCFAAHPPSLFCVRVTVNPASRATSRNSWTRLVNRALECLMDPRHHLPQFLITQLLKIQVFNAQGCFCHCP